ncbi:MAG: diguanylate cyclase [Chloroflexota bacterium]|nr:GGDEF domain-containing protein [Chloroflexota bacterium]MBI5704789.1 GGDEF domain-containing protein [Chloroflexota bacterium]
MKEQVLQILAEARKRLDAANVSHSERDILLKLIGVLVDSMQHFTHNSEDLNSLAQAVVDQRALLALLKQQADELDALKKLSINLTSSLDLPDVLDALSSEALRLIPNAQDVHIFLYADGKLSFGAALDFDGNKNTVWSKPRPNGLTYTVARSGEMIIVEDMQNHPLFVNVPSNWRGSIIGIPLKTDDTVVGVMNLARSQVGGFSSSEQRLLSLLADQAAVAIANARLHQMVSRQAYSDMLTGLPNRRALDERLDEEIQSARRGNYSFAVVMMDLDGFKAVNDTYGHIIGDEVLRLVFNQMARRVRTTDFLARYGGDELTLILSQSDIASAKVVTSKISEEMQRIKYTLPDKKRLNLSVSGGIALYPVHARTASDLLRAADAALYQAKKHHRGTFQIARGVTGPLTSHSIIVE